MTTGEKLQNLRKQNNITQEQLADLLGVSRQSISKWESDLAWPETDKLIRLSELYHVSVDYLLKENVTKKGEPEKKEAFFDRFHYEYKSRRTWHGKPLIHVNVGFGMHKANGIIAIGNAAKGVIAIGFFSMGFLSLGAFSLGLLSLGAFSLGGFALGGVAIGIIAMAAIAVGLFSIGAISVGCFSVGAISVAKYVAIGDRAYGSIALGKEFAKGSIFESYSGRNSFVYDKESVIEVIDQNVPGYWRFFIDWIKAFLI